MAGPRSAFFKERLKLDSEVEFVTWRRPLSRVAGDDVIVCVAANVTKARSNNEVR